MKKTVDKTHVVGWATAIDTSVEETAAAWDDLRRRGLASMKCGTVTMSPLALRRATSDVQRRLAAHLSGYLMTENSYIVCRVGNPAGDYLHHRRTSTRSHQCKLVGHRRVSQCSGP